MVRTAVKVLPAGSLTTSDAVIVVSSSNADRSTVEAAAVPLTIATVALCVPPLNTTLPLSFEDSLPTVKATALAPAEPTGTVEPSSTVSASGLTSGALSDVNVWPVSSMYEASTRIARTASSSARTT